MVEGGFLVSVLRHGEVAGRAHVFRGAADEPLSARGRMQMQGAVECLGVPPFDRIAASPLARCRDFAQALAEAAGLPFDVLPDLREMHFGAFEGLNSAEAAAAHPAAYEALSQWRAGSAAPGGERLENFRGRVVAAWEAWLAATGGRHRLLVTHAGVMRVLLQHVLGLPDERLRRLALPEAAHFRLACLAGHAPILLSLNPCADSFSPSGS